MLSAAERISEMLDRAQVIDEQFIKRVKAADFPKPKSTTTLIDAGLSKQKAIEIFDSQIKSRLLDIIARQLKEKGLSFYTIGSSGHEGNAAIAEAYRHTDMAFLHYRSGGFYLQRSKRVEAVDGVRDMLLSLVAAKDEPISGGRHKVFGSVPLNIPPQTSTIASHLPKALGTAFSLNRAKALKLTTPLPQDSVILCSFGDASFNHASSQTTFNACAWMANQQYPLPIVWVCEDNGIGISVPTPKTWVADVMSQKKGIHYVSCDGLNIADVFQKATKAELIARENGIPVFLHMHCVRLMGHAGSDIESQYRTEAEIIATEADDPLLHTARLMVEQGVMSVEAIISLYQDNRALIEAKSLEVLRMPRLSSAKEIMSSILPKPFKASPKTTVTDAMRQQAFGAQFTQLNQKRNLCAQLNYALTDLMLEYDNMVVFGEDVGKKGGVYRVTADLQARFGARRVFDSILDETTILGTAIGLAHNGFLPVPEIQFLAYLHNAEDQLRGEAATLSYFSNGQYRNPMLIRIASLAYQKGFGGHFHNDNSIAVLRDLPGVIVACPSNGPDAAMMLRTCMEMAHTEGRIVVFLEPIALYMTKDLHASGDNEWLHPYPAPDKRIKYGEVGTFGQGDTVILTYANGYYLSRQAAKRLKDEHQINVKIVDLRWLAPLPEAAILKEVAKAKRILIVDEGRRSASISEALMTLLLEKSPNLPQVSRLTGEDCFIPLGTAWQHLLPSTERIIDEVLALQEKQKENQRGRFIIS